MTALFLSNFDSLPDNAGLSNEYIRALLGISRSTVYRLVKAGKLTPIKIGERATRYRVEEVRKLLEGV